MQIVIIQLIAVYNIILQNQLAEANLINNQLFANTLNYSKIVQEFHRTFGQSFGYGRIISGIFYTIFLTFLLYLLFKLINYTFELMNRNIDSWLQKHRKFLKFHKRDFLPLDLIAGLFVSIIKGFKFILKVIIFYFYLTIIFSLFPFTLGIARLLVSNLANTVIVIWNAFINYLPSLIYIAIIIVIIRYIIKVIRIIFSEVKKGRIVIPGFYQEWADPTFKIVRFLGISLAIALIYPYLPGSASPAFKGVSIFLGILVSLGSTVAIANIVAGVILTYTRALRDGDRVKIGNTMGDVEEKTLLVTRIRSIKNEIISIPNSVVLTSHIINYSSSAEEPGLILNTNVTISYDVSWQKVHELLIQAGLATQNISEKPPPFVLQRRLNNSYVTYELNAYTNKPHIMQNTYSELHKNIQNKFNEAGIEIMSTRYTSIRDGNNIAIPKSYIPEEYTPPVFKIMQQNDSSNKTESQSE